MTSRVLKWALEKADLNQKVGIASVVSTAGSVPGKVGAKLALTKSEVFGTVGGAGLELKVIARLKEMLELAKKPIGEVLTYGLNKSAKGYEVKPLDSLCGGRVTVALEVLIPMPHILLMGGGHCAKAIADACIPVNGNAVILPATQAVLRAEHTDRCCMTSNISVCIGGVVAWPHDSVHCAHRRATGRRDRETMPRRLPVDSR